MSLAAEFVEHTKSSHKRRDRLRRDLWRTFHKRGLNNEDELDFFIQEYLGYRIPRNKFHEDSTPPFQLVSDMFFEREDKALGWASRSSGKTRVVSVLNYLDMDFKGGVDIAHAGATLDQTARAYRYFLSYLNENMIRSRLRKTLRSYTTFVNDSNLEIVTGTIKGLNSPHTNKLRLDEVELMEWRALEEAASITISSRKYKAQDVLTSTRKFSRGVMTRLIKEAPARGYKIYKWDIFDVLAKCKRDCLKDKRYGDCPAYSRLVPQADGTMKEEALCGGRAHHGVDGFYSIDDFIKKVKVMDWATFRAQWLNKEPTGGKLVYGEDELNPHFHKFSWDKFKAITGYERPPAHWIRIGGIDFGSIFCYYKAVKCPPDVLGGMVFVYFEYYYDASKDRPRLLSEHSLQIKNSPDWTPNEVIYCDHSAKQDMLELKGNGIPLVAPAIKDVLLGINSVKELLKVNPTTKLPGVMFHESLVNFWREVESYSHPELPDGEIDYDDVIKVEDHGCDAVRYMLHTDKVKPFRIGYSTYRIEGLR